MKSAVELSDALLGEAIMKVRKGTWKAQDINALTGGKIHFHVSFVKGTTRIYAIIHAGAPRCPSVERLCDVVLKENDDLSCQLCQLLQP